MHQPTPPPTSCRNASAANTRYICSGVVLGSASSLAEFSSPTTFANAPLPTAFIVELLLDQLLLSWSFRVQFAPNQDPAIAAAGPQVTAAAAAVVQAPAVAADVLPGPAVAAAGLPNPAAAAAAIKNQPINHQ